MYPYIYLVLSSYWVMAGIGIFASLCLLYFRLEKYDLKFMQFMKFAALSVIGTAIGSKLLFAITKIPWLVQHFSFENLILLIPQSGFVFYGGLFGMIFILLFATRKDMEQRKKIFSFIVPAIPLFHAFGRIGCFLTGCCYGKELSHSVVVGPIEFGYIPIQLIEALAEFIIFAIILILEKKKKDLNSLQAYLCIYAIVRFIDEFWRGDEVRGLVLGISTSQWISMAILVVYLIKWIKAKRIHNNPQNAVSE